MHGVNHYMHHTSACTALHAESHGCLCASSCSDMSLLAFVCLQTRQCTISASFSIQATFSPLNTTHTVQLLQGPMPEAYGYHVVPCLTTPQSAQLCSAYSISCSPTTFSTPHMGTDQQQHPQLKTSASHDESADSNDARPTPTAPSYPRFQTLYRLAHDDSSRMLSGPAVKCAAASAAQPMPTQSGHVHISHAFIQTQSGSDPVLIPPKAPRRPQPQGPFCSNNPYMPKHSQPRQQLLDQYPHMLSMIQSASTDIHDRSVPQAVWSFPLEPRQPQAKNLSSPEQTSTLHASKPLPSIKQVLQKLEKQSATADTASSH